MEKRKGKNFHVVPRDGRWVVKPEGGRGASSVHDTQREAIDQAQEIARNQGGALVIHGRDGRIRDRVSYGAVPLPPKSPREVLFPKTEMVTSKKAIKKAVHEVIWKSHATSQSKDNQKS